MSRSGRGRNLSAGDALIGVLVIAVAALAAWVMLRDVSPPVSAADLARPDSTAAAGSSLSTPTPPADPSTAPDGPIASFAVIGDGVSAGDRAWPAAFAEQTGLELLDVSANSRAGYVAAGRDGTFGDLVAGIGPTPPDLVVLLGSQADAASTGRQVRDAAAAAISDLRTAQPDTQEVVIGPLWATWAPPDGDPNGARAGVKAAARSSSATYVDPQADGGWLNETNRDLVRNDRATPTSEGATYVASRVVDALTAAGIELPVAAIG